MSLKTPARFLETDPVTIDSSERGPLTVHPDIAGFGAALRAYRTLPGNAAKGASDLLGTGGGDSGLTPTVSWTDVIGPVIGGRAANFGGGTLTVRLPGGATRTVPIQIGGTWSLTVEASVEAGSVLAQLTMPDGARIDASASYTPQPVQPPEVDPGFNPPQGVTAQVGTDSRVRLAWRGVEEAEQYNIERKASTATAYGYVTTILSGATSYDDAPPAPGTWDYRVIAVNTNPSPLAYTAASAAVSATTGAPSGELDVSGMTLVFNDEFAVEPAVGGWTGEPGWRLGVDDDWIAHTPWFGDFGDADFSDPDTAPGRPFKVIDGILHITAWIDGTKQKNGQTVPRWRSGLLCSMDTAYEGFAAPLGYFECRMKVPSGDGTWPAFWLNSTKTAQGISVEVDAVEMYGQFPDTVHHVWHTWPSEPHVSRQKVITRPGLQAGFHRFGVEVTPTEYIYYIDRIETWRSTRPANHQGVSFFPMVNLALGSGWPIENTPNPSVLEVDYVRVFDNPSPTPPKGPPGTGGSPGENWRAHMAFLDPAMILDARTANIQNGGSLTSMPNGGDDAFDSTWRVSGQATYRDAAAGFAGPAIDFGPGSSAVLEGLYYAQPVSLVVIAEQRRRVTGAVLAGAKDWSGDRLHAQVAPDGKWEMSGGVAGQSSLVADTDPHVYLITAQDGVHTLYVDGVEAARRTSGAGLNGMRVGALLDTGDPNTASGELRLSYAAAFEGALDAAGRETITRLGRDYRTGTVGSDGGGGGGTTPTLSRAERALDAELARHTLPYHLNPRRVDVVSSSTVTEIANAGNDPFANAWRASGPVTYRQSETGYDTPVLVCGAAASLVAPGNWYGAPHTIFLIGEAGRVANGAVLVGAKDWSGDRSHVQSASGKLGSWVGASADSTIDLDTDPHVYALRVANGAASLFLDGVRIAQVSGGAGLNGMRVGALLDAAETDAYSAQVTVARAFAITGALSDADITRISNLGTAFIAGDPD